ncbi:MBL fold metallo-hydrolase [Mycobacterium antarcticum]|uniref:MBL fold metallo-hydrolase n=1 Tax=unclassified Mycolicibacterium TaxID=2636767 RepID=UPI0023971533|nr:MULTISPECIES: MBL fold metallo-hydrolase [unclassified Mycolicibacterium]BDX34351.1 MBL fold metallo-hydrolase [Mycolicibacterium sp. TUM20985]GLP77559.1 MBL fold metallo-hydrolase [Mycolicibacterium sp. TUM20983]
MIVSIIETSGLGDRSYLVSDDDVAVVIDPQRDIDRVLRLASEHGVRITHVLETHIHNDYVTGGLELARVADAEYVVPAGDDVDYERRAIGDGDVIDAGPIQLKAMHTPGHTHHHISYVLSDPNGVSVAVFTGGSMLHGTTGRTDLLGPEHTSELTHAQFHSVRRLADELPDGVEVYPTHGFGSFCSATPSNGDSSTIADERQHNPALTQDEQAYVDQLIAGLSAYPAYYAHMGVINAAGPEPVDLSTPEPVDPTELRRRIEVGEWVVDLRNRTAFAAGHLDGTYAFELSNSFVTYLGWLYRWGAPLTLIGDDDAQIADARRELVRIGVDNVTGSSVGDIAKLSGGTPPRSYRVADFGELAEAMNERGLTVLDVRQQGEYAESHITGAIHIPLHELLDRTAEVPTGEVWVHCGSGYRSSIAASMIDEPGRDVVLVDDTYDGADTLDRTV